MKKTVEIKEKRQSKRPSKKTKEDLTLKAYNSIREMLLFNEIAIGQKIHYPDIADKLGMSPTPIIQALKWMQFQGLVRHESNQGFYLEDISIEEVEELYEIRQSLELTFLDRAIRRIDDEKIARLKASLDAYSEATERKLPKVRIIRDMEFHMTIASLSGGRPGGLILQHVFDLLYLKYRTYLLMLKSGEEFHQKIFDCVEKRDREGALDAMSKHISGVGNDILEQLRVNLEEKKTLKMI